MLRTLLPTCPRKSARPRWKRRARVEQLRNEGKLAPVGRGDIIIRHAGDGGRIESPNLRLGPLAGAMADMTWAAKATSKELGTRDIEGIKAEGELRSYDIPAGKVVAATPSRYPTRAGIRPNCG